MGLRFLWVCLVGVFLGSEVENQFLIQYLSGFKKKKWTGLLDPSDDFLQQFLLPGNQKGITMPVQRLSKWLKGSQVVLSV